MPDSMMAVSPEVNAYGQSVGPEQEEQLFKQKFTEMAYSALSAKFAELMPFVITFKILESKLEDSSALGVFILNYQNKPIYVPVVLREGKLKPLEIVYYKELNTFLPLSKMWLDEISKMDVAEMGSPAKLPKEVQQDLNIRDLVLPPQTINGRVGYASADLDHAAKDMFKEAEVQEYNVKPTQFLNIMRNAPRYALDGMKLAFETNPSLLQSFTKVYGIDALTEAMQAGYQKVASLEKTAAENPGGTLKVFTKTASVDALKAAFGERAGDAYHMLRKHGYIIEDNRPRVEKTIAKVEKPTFLEEPGAGAGWFRLYCLDSSPQEYLIVPFPKNSRNRGRVYHCSCGGNQRLDMDYLAISKDGKEAWTTNHLVGERLMHTNADVSGSKLYKILEDGGPGDTPSVGDLGFFINITDRSIEVTEPCTVDRVSSDANTTTVYTKYSDTYIIDKDSVRKCIDTTSDFIFIPQSAKFVRMGPASDGNLQEMCRRRKSSIIKDPKVLLRWMNHVMQQSGAQKPQVKSAGLNQWWVGGGSTPLSLGTAIEKVATMYGISAGDACGVLENAQELGSPDLYVVPTTAFRNIKNAFAKYAAPMQEVPMAAQGNAAAMGQMAPVPGQEYNMAGGQAPMDPMAMGQQTLPPEPISPTDLAIGEAVQGLQQESQLQMQQAQAQMDQMQQQLDMQQQSNEQLIGVLQGIQQRAAQISDATGGQVPPNAMESPMAAAQAIAPVPEEEEPPPMPMMDQDATSPEMVAEQINPEMIDQAEAFQNDGMFDTAAVSMLASAPVLQDIVSAYVPNLEKAIDNMGRILLTLWMKEADTKDAIGDETYIEIEDKLRTLFKNMGDIVLTLSHSAMTAQGDSANSQMTMQAAQG